MEAQEAKEEARKREKQWLKKKKKKAPGHLAQRCDDDAYLPSPISHLSYYHQAHLVNANGCTSCRLEKRQRENRWRHRAPPPAPSQQKNGKIGNHLYDKPGSCGDEGDIMRASRGGLAGGIDTSLAPYRVRCLNIIVRLLCDGLYLGHGRQGGRRVRQSLA